MASGRCPLFGVAPTIAHAPSPGEKFTGAGHRGCGTRVAEVTSQTRGADLLPARAKEERRCVSIENRTTTLYLNARTPQNCVVGQNCVHTIFNAAGRKIYTYVDVGAAAAPFRPHVRIRRPWGSGWEGERLPFLELADSFVAYALSGDWRRGARVAA